MALLGLGVAALIFGWIMWTIIREEESVELAKAPASTPWFAPPDNSVLELKAVRIRTDPEAAAEPGTQIGRPAGWNAEDDATLLRLLGENLPAAEIATKLGRSEKAVQLRIPLLRLRERQTEQAERSTNPACSA